MKITANQVTLARIFFIPIPSALILWNKPTGYLLALLIGAVLGATDAIDGYLARRDGPTVLGALLDPMADKLFFAAFVLPLCAAGHCPPWVAAGVFGRELLITALRTSMAVRKTRLKTSELGKLKTVVQMGGLAVFYFTAFLPDPWHLVVNAAGAGGFVLAFILSFVRKKRWPSFWVNGTAPVWTVVAIMAFTFGRSAAIDTIFVVMLILTWVSGIDYLSGAWREMRRSGFKPGDLSRIAWSVAHAATIGVVMTLQPGAVVPLLISLAGELALGGIDNVVSASEGATGGAKVRFEVSSAAAVITLVLAAALPAGHVAVLVAAWGLALASGVQAARAFLKDREVFA